MRFSRALNVVDAHAEGESGKVVVCGVGPVPGENPFDKMRYFEGHYDQLRKLLEPTEYPVMSGSNTMCVATVLLETGALPMTEPVTHLTLESPAGLKLVNQPSFVFVDASPGEPADPRHHERRVRRAAPPRAGRGRRRDDPSRNATVDSPGRIDRSPCGTGTSARLAVLHAYGLLEQGQLFRHESLIGSRFDARIESTTTLTALRQMP